MNFTKIITSFTCIILATLMFSNISLAQSDNKVPDVQLRTSDNSIIQSSKLLDGKAPTLIVLWETICKPSIELLNIVNENYSDWNEQIHFNVVAIAIDNSRTATKVPVVSHTNGWEFNVFLDPNQDFKRAISALVCPSYYIVNQNGEIVFKKPSYVPGDENIILFELLKLKK